jgi:hypothetical protein
MPPRRAATQCSGWTSCTVSPLSARQRFRSFRRWARSVRDLQKRMERAGLEIEEVFKPVPGFALVVARKSGLRLRTRTPHRPRASGYSRSVGPLAMIPPKPLQIISVV